MTVSESAAAEHSHAAHVQMGAERLKRKPLHAGLAWSRSSAARPT